MKITLFLQVLLNASCYLQVANDTSCELIETELQVQHNCLVDSEFTIKKFLAETWLY